MKQKNEGTSGRRNAKNGNLTAARVNKNDEFYTQYEDIEAEMNAYVEHNPDVFRNKTVLLPCDDPEWSNFTKYFSQNFERLGLKKLISTSYAKGASNEQLTLFESESPLFDKEKHETRGKLFVLTHDRNGSGNIDTDDIEFSGYLEGDGDFRSEEVTRLRDEADFIVTNPPFSLFREFLAWIMAVGIDLGIKTLVTCSDGKAYENPHELKKAEKRLKHAQRAVNRRKNARKKSKEAGNKESHRLQRARLKLQRRHAKVRNRRKDRIEYLTSKILHANDVVCMEDLNTKGMMKNHHLAKSIADASFGMLRQIFARKAKTRGKKIVLVGRRFPSSQICSICGARTSATKNLAVRSWTCPSCGVAHDRDLNASVNILNEGLKILDTEADTLAEWLRQGTAASARRRNVRGGHTGVLETLGIPPSDEAHSSAQGINTLR